MAKFSVSVSARKAAGKPNKLHSLLLAQKVELLSGRTQRSRDDG